MLSKAKLVTSAVGRSLSTRATNSTSRASLDASRKVLTSMSNNQDSTSVHHINSRLETLSLTSAYLSGVPLASIKLPSLGINPITTPPSTKNINYVVPDINNKKIIEEPEVKGEMINPGRVTYAKYAHRMLRIRKRKMKVHRRKRRAKRDKAKNQKIRFNRAKNKEITFRLKLIHKVKAAKKFEASEYVEDKLSEYERELTPLTYKGKRLPQWLIKELVIKDELTKKEKVNNQLDVITGEKLVRDGETVEQFRERISHRYKK